MLKWTNKQKEYLLNANKRWNFKTGAVRSGKTFLDYEHLIPLRIRQVKDKDGLIFILGVTKNTIERNVLQPMRKKFSSRLVGEINSNNEVMLFGERCYALGAEKSNQISKVQGAGCKYAYGDEVAKWNEDFFAMIKSRLDKPYSIFDGTNNPENPRHYLKEFLDSDIDIYYQHYTIDDNPFLDPFFVAQLKKEYAGTVFYDRYILGLWTQAEGLIYPNYEKSIVPTVNRNYTEIQLSIDYGIHNPFVIGMYGLCDGIWYKVKEYHHSGRDSNEQKTDNDYLRELEKFVGGLALRKIIIDPSASSFIALLKQKGYTVQKAKNDVIDGISVTLSAMEQGKVKINNCCVESIKEFGVYSWDDKSGEDKPIKDNDHHCDELRYFCLTNGLVRSPSRIIGA